MIRFKRSATGADPAPRAGIAVALARLDGGEGDAAVLEAAAQIATRLTAHVTVVHVRLLPPSTAELAGRSDDSFAGFGPSEEREAAARAEAVRVRFDAWRTGHGWPVAAVRDAGPSTGRLDLDGDEPGVLAERARLFDITIMVRPDASLATFEAVIVGSGRPVLMVPPDWHGDLFAGAVIAWNGSVQASRALAASMPMLAASTGQAMVFSAAERGRAAAGHAVAEYLGQHGLGAGIAAPEPGDIAAQLLAAARAAGAGLIVCGAYSKGRLRQSLFGGVTTHLLAQADTPVLFTN